MAKVMNIESVEDIEKVRAAILNNEQFEIGTVRPLTYRIVMKGGRFEDYDTAHIDAYVAKVVIANQRNYDKLLKEIEKKFNITFSPEDKLLRFTIQKGSLEFISDIFDVLEVLKQMDSLHQMYLVLGLAGMWFAHSAYTKKVEKDIETARHSKEETIKKLEGEEKQAYIETINHAIDGLKDALVDKNLQDAINNPKKEMLGMLEDDEKLFVDNTPLSRQQIETFEYVRPVVEDIEEEVDGVYTIESYNFHKPGKLFKIVGIPVFANSEIITAEKRMRIISKAENQVDIPLKLKVTKDGISKKIKSVYIIDVGAAAS